MDKLLISGLAYIPIADPKPNHANLLHTEANFKKQKFPIDIVEQYERFSVGKITRIRQVWMNIKGYEKKVPAYYALGYINHPKTITQILESAKGHRDDYHSWCSVFNHSDYMHKVEYNGKKVWEETTIDGYTGEWDNFVSAFVCCTPCLTGSHLFIPYADRKMNDTLIKKNFTYQQRCGTLNARAKSLFNKFKMDHDLFWKLFGDNFKKDKYINFQNLRTYGDVY